MAGSSSSQTVSRPIRRRRLRDDRTGAQTYFAYDGLGSTANLTDGNGATTATYSYDVFGALRSPEPSSTNEWRFTGEQRDRQGGREYYYLRARFYDPATGRFLSQDPIRAGHPYTYAANSPTTYVDRTGLCHDDPAGGSHPYIGGDDDYTDLDGDPWGCPESGIGPDDLLDPVVDTFGPPWTTTKLTQFADSIPLELICGAGGAVAGTLIAPGAGTAAGGASAYVTCKTGVFALSILAAYKTQVQIMTSKCSNAIKIEASVINAVNLGVDAAGPRLPKAIRDLKWYVVLPIEGAAYVGSSELMQCKE